jgi:hypothetical protein
MGGTNVFFSGFTLSPQLSFTSNLRYAAAHGVLCSCSWQSQVIGYLYDHSFYHPFTSIQRILLLLSRVNKVQFIYFNFHDLTFLLFQLGWPQQNLLSFLHPSKATASTAGGELQGC